jgi:putative flippase GtrA
MTDPAATADLSEGPVAAPERRSVRQMARELDWRKALKYSAVSMIAFPLSLIVLNVCHYGLGWTGVQANFAAVAVTAIPAYVLNRYWVWGKTDKNKFFTEIVPFWGMTFLGLIFSTLLVDWADRNIDSGLAITFANAAGFGIVWVFKFLVLDKAMFGRKHHFTPEVEEELIEREEEHEAHHQG